MAGADFQKCPFFKVSGVFKSTSELIVVGSNPTVSAKKSPEAQGSRGFSLFSIVWLFVWFF